MRNNYDQVRDSMNRKSDWHLHWSFNRTRIPASGLRELPPPNAFILRQRTDSGPRYYVKAQGFSATERRHASVVPRAVALRLRRDNVTLCPA